MLIRRVCWGIGLAFCLGCVPHTDEPSTASAPATAPAPSTAAPATSPPAATPPSDPSTAVAPAADAIPPAASAPATPAVAAPAAPATEQVEAKAGVGLKGQSLQQESGVMVEAAKAYFNFKQKAVFDIQIPQALNLFKASEGRAPQSHDEFMTKIIAANSIKLPELPAGHKYIYDPQKEDLMVERPAKK